MRRATFATRTTASGHARQPGDWGWGHRQVGRSPVKDARSVFKKDALPVGAEFLVLWEILGTRRLLDLKLGQQQPYSWPALSRVRDPIAASGCLAVSWSDPQNACASRSPSGPTSRMSRPEKLRQLWGQAKPRHPSQQPGAHRHFVRQRKLAPRRCPAKAPKGSGSLTWEIRTHMSVELG